MQKKLWTIKSIQDKVRSYGSFQPEHVVTGNAEIFDYSSSEVAYSVGFPEAALAVNANVGIAEGYTEQFFGVDWNRDVTQANAFKHAMWQALNCRSIGDTKTFLFACAHEDKPGNDDADREYRPTINAARDRAQTTFYEATRMDLHNNAIGIAIGSVSQDMSNDFLAEVVREIVINQNQGIWLWP